MKAETLADFLDWLHKHDHDVGRYDIARFEIDVEGEDGIVHVGQDRTLMLPLKKAETDALIETYLKETA